MVCVCLYVCLYVRVCFRQMLTQVLENELLPLSGCQWDIADFIKKNLILITMGIDQMREFEISADGKN